MTGNRNTQFFVAVLAAAALTAWAVTGCELIASVDRSRIAGTGGEGTGGDQPNGGGGTGGTGGTGGGGGPECDPLMCDGVDTDCRFRACDASQVCGFENAIAGDDCDDGASADAAVCDGIGTCVECNENADCTFDVMATECDNTICVPATCTDGVINGTETDIDCGGTLCAPCDDTEDCLVDSDCSSLFCNALTCAPCAVDGECADLAGHYCDLAAGGTQFDCVPKLVLGSVCTGNNTMCVSNFCVTEPGQPNGVCCNGLCGATDCESCRVVDTGLGAGVCGPIAAGDPYTECTQSAPNAVACEGANCSGSAAACAPAPNTVVCRNDSDGTALCDAAENCAGALTCPANGFEAAGTACGSSTNTPPCNLADTCQGGSAVCNDNNATNGTNCTGVVNGGACNIQDTCQSAVCVDNFATAGAACGDATNTPPCNLADTCAGGSGTCNNNNAANGTNCTGAVNGGACNLQDTCQAAVCTDAFAAAGTSCGSGIAEPVCNPDTCTALGVCTDVAPLNACQACTQNGGVGCSGGSCVNPCP